ncbi:hypothetical protein [Vibrio phage phiKT1024]|nr:hypothetical protein [Vibrio phage phiKT1024]
MIEQEYRNILKDERAVEVDCSSERVKEFIRDLDPHCNPREVRMFFQPDEHRFLVYSIPKLTERIHGLAIMSCTFFVWCWFEGWRAEICDDFRGLMNTDELNSSPICVFTLEYLMQDKNFGGLGKKILLDINMSEYLI